MSDPTFVDLKKIYSEGFADGSSLYAEIYRTNVSIAGLTVSMPIGIAINDTLSVATFGDGLMGLGFNSVSRIFNATGLSASFIDNVGFPQANKMFSFYLSNGNDGDSGEVTFGGYDTSKFKGAITYFPVNEFLLPGIQTSLFWAFSITNYTVSIGGKTPMAPIPISTNSKLQNAVSDTGTSLIILPLATADAINNNLGAPYVVDYGVYVLSCSFSTTGPDVVLTMGGVDFAVPASIYVMFDSNSGICYSGFVRGAESVSAIIFGDPFLRTCKF